MEQHNGEPDTGLAIAATILLNVGVIPLIVADLGLTRIILMDNFGDGPFTHRITVGLRLTFVGAIALLGAGGGIGSQPDPDLVHTGHNLVLAGYIVFAAELVALTLMQVYYHARKSSPQPSGHQVLRGALLASPFIMVRTVYGLIESAHAQETRTLGTRVWLPHCFFDRLVCLDGVGYGIHGAPHLPLVWLLNCTGSWAGWKERCRASSKTMR
ncbi:hypothetical protein MAJ_00567, partial [Metarhizium majus ARSEF 297]